MDATMKFALGCWGVGIASYRVVRHPIYSGLLLMLLGTAVLVRQVGAFLVLVFCFFGFWVKLRQEEALLTPQFYLLLGQRWCPA